MDDGNNDAPVVDKQEPAEKRLPICPHCGAQPMHPDGHSYNTKTGVRLLIISCATCYKVLSIAILPPNEVIVPVRHMPQ